MFTDSVDKKRMGNYLLGEREYYDEIIDISDVFGDVDIKSRDYDCVLVFDKGSNDDFVVNGNMRLNSYEYLKWLDWNDIDKRRSLFPTDGASFSQGHIKQKDFFRHERELIIQKVLTQLEIKCKKIKCLGKEWEKNNQKVMYYIGIKEDTARRFADKINYEVEIDPEACCHYLAYAFKYIIIFISEVMYME